MRWLAISIAPLMLANGANAAEGDVREFPFECYVVNADGSARVISGKRIETDATHMYQPYIDHAFEIVDRGEKRRTEFVGHYPDQTFEVSFSADAPEDAPTFIRFHHYESYKIYWTGAPVREGMITLQKWSERRPAVREKIRQTAAGMCKFFEEGVEA